MSRIAILFISGLLGLFYFGCASKALQTPQQFVETFQKNMLAENGEALFEMFINTREEVKLKNRYLDDFYLRQPKGIKKDPEMMKEMARNFEKEIDETMEAIHDHKGRMVKVMWSKTVSDWKVMTLDSVSQGPLTTHNKNLNLPDNMRASDIIGHFLFKEKPYVIRFKCLDFGDGVWKMIEYPRHISE